MHKQEGIFYNSKGEPRPYRLAFPDTKPNSKKPVPLAVFAHGFGGSYDSDYIVSNTPYFLEAGIATMSFNFCNPRHDKVCTKNLTPNNALDDLTSGIRFISQDARVNKNKMVGVAASFGAFTMMRYAADEKNPPLKGMVLYSAVPDPIAPFKKELNLIKEVWWRMREFTDVEVEGDICPIAYQCYEEAKSIDLYRDAASLITCPVLNIHGDKDDLASVADIYKLHKAMTAAPKKDVRVINGAKHAFALARTQAHIPSPMEQAVAYTQMGIADMLHENSQTLTWAEQMIVHTVVGALRLKNALGFNGTTPAKNAAMPA